MLKLYKNDIVHFPKMNMLLIYRRSLKLLRQYPSAKRDEMREAIIEEYHENQNLEDKNKIKEAQDNARGFLRHLYTYEAARRQLLGIPFYDDEEEERNKSITIAASKPSKKIDLSMGFKGAKKKDESFEEF